VLPAKEDEAAELICRFTFFACSSADDDFFAQKANLTTDKYGCHGFYFLIRVNRCYLSQGFLCKARNELPGTLSRSGT